MSHLAGGGGPVLPSAGYMDKIQYNKTEVPPHTHNRIGILNNCRRGDAITMSVLACVSIKEMLQPFFRQKEGVIFSTL